VLSEEKEGQENRFLKRVMAVIHHYYRPALHWCLARPKTTVVAAIGGSLLLSAVLVPVIGSSLFPKADTPQFLIQVESPNGTSLTETDRALRAVEDELSKMPEVKSWFANLGHGKSADLLQPHPAQRCVQLRRSVRAAPRIRHGRNSDQAAGLA
jgi:multidrug efflux pump subunit AcrB